MPVVPYVRQTWADGAGGGTPTSAARLNVIEAGVNDVSYAPAVHVTHNAAQTITSGVETTLAFNTERFDQAGNVADTMHDTVTNNSRLTCRYAGVYLITAQVSWSAAPTNANLIIRLGGTTQIGYDEHSGVGHNLSILYALAVNDFVEVRVTQTSGSNKDVSSVGNKTPEFMMVRVG